MQAELDAAHEECCLVQEKIVQMGCVNFELEYELKDAKEKLAKAEMQVRQAAEQVEETRRNCAQQEEHQKSLQSEFLAKVKNVKNDFIQIYLENWN